MTLVRFAALTMIRGEITLTFYCIGGEVARGVSDSIYAGQGAGQVEVAEVRRCL